MQLLRNVSADEVSPVKRGANRKRVVLKADGEAHMETEITDIMAVPWEREGAMIDELRAEGADENVVKAAVGAMRLLSGVADELPDGMREAVEKLGSEMYPRLNPQLNTTGVPSPGGLVGDSYGDDMDGSAGKQTDLDGSGTDGELSGTGSAPKVAADDCDDMDEDGVMKDGKEPYGDVTYADPGYQSDGKKRYPLDTDAHVRAAWSYINMPKNAAKYKGAQVSSMKSKIRAAMKRVGADVEKDDPVAKAFRVIKNALGISSGSDTTGNNFTFRMGEVEDEPATTDEVEKGGTVETHAVPIQKEDGSWDLSGVPDGSRPFYEAMIAKAAEADATRVQLEKAEETVATLSDELRTKDIIAKAETEFQNVGARDDVVEVLKDASAKLSPEAYEKLVTVLAAANEKIEKGDLFTELGRTVPTDGSGTDAWEKIEKAADALVEKSDSGMTREQAVDRVMQTAEGAALYSAYMRETGLGVN